MVISANIYCSFCGIHLPNNHDEYSTSPVTRKRHWFEEARAVAVDGSSSSLAHLSGIGVLLFRHSLSAPLSSELWYTDTEVLQGIRLLQPTSTWWGYGFHNSCWALFRARLAHVQNITDIVSSVFDQFHATACPHFSTLDFGHDYDGAGATQKAYGAPTLIDPNSTFLADPCAVPTAEDIQNSVPELPEVECPKSANSHSVNNFSWHHSLGRLPLEVLYEVFSYLSFSHLLDIRYVCRDLALLSRPDKLPDSFWRSQFMIGSEQDFLFMDVTEKRNWSRLFRGTRSLMKYPSMVNRKRIRKLLEPIAAMVELGMTTTKRVVGTCVVMDRDSGTWRSVGDGTPGNAIPALRRTTLLSGRTSGPSARSQREAGCRLAQHRAASFPRRFSASVGYFEISTVRLSFNQYISGINYIDAGSSSHTSEIGVDTGFQKESIKIPGTGSIEGIEVAFRPGGLVGIRMHFDSGESCWAGQHAGDEIAFGYIPVPKTADHFYLVTGLDVRARKLVIQLFADRIYQGI